VRSFLFVLPGVRKHRRKRSAANHVRRDTCRSVVSCRRIGISGANRYALTSAAGARHWDIPRVRSDRLDRRLQYLSYRPNRFSRHRKRVGRARFPDHGSSHDGDRRLGAASSEYSTCANRTSAGNSLRTHHRPISCQSLHPAVSRLAGLALCEAPPVGQRPPSALIGDVRHF
jgi:hypothetical protein